MITWELAIDRYKLSKFYLERLAITTNKNLCDADKRLVKDVWYNPPSCFYRPECTTPIPKVGLWKSLWKSLWKKR